MRCSRAACPSSKKAPKRCSPRRSRDKRLFFTSKPSEISGTGPVIVTIGTPVDEFLNPVRAGDRDCIDALLPHLTRRPASGAAIDAISRHHRLDRQPTSRARAASLKVAFCPERIVQGHGIERTGNGMPQLLSGTRQTRKEAAELFGMIAPKIVMLEPDRGGVRQAVQQRLSLHRIRHHQPVLSDREVRRSRLSAAFCRR